MANQNFVTLEMVKELLATQQQAFWLLVTDIKDSIKEVKKDSEELKRILEFSQKNLTLFKPGFFWFSMTGGGGGFHPLQKTMLQLS